MYANYGNVDCESWYPPRCLAEGVKGEKIVLFDLKRLAEILQPRAEDAAEGVLIRNAEHDHSAAVVAVEVDALRNLGFWG